MKNTYNNRTHKVNKYRCPVCGWQGTAEDMKLSEPQVIKDVAAVLYTRVCPRCGHDELTKV
jgi:predicted RNA-binding Zn-ribbon protein involved in translation (DUF1610 family)